MRQPAARLLIAVLLGGAAGAACAADDGAAAWRAAERARAVEHALSDRYTAIWSTLDARQKPAFAVRERAWLNGGRQQQEQACIEAAGERSELVAQTCAAAVVERHLQSLAAPRQVTAAN